MITTLKDLMEKVDSIHKRYGISAERCMVTIKRHMELRAIKHPRQVQQQGRAAEGREVCVVPSTLLLSFKYHYLSPHIYFCSYNIV